MNSAASGSFGLPFAAVRVAAIARFTRARLRRTRVSPAEFKTLVAAFGADVTTTMTPQQARAELARGQGLNRLAKQYTTAAKPVSVSAVPGNGFNWGDAGIGVAAAIGSMLLAAAGAIGLRKRGRLVLHS